MLVRYAMPAKRADRMHEPGHARRSSAIQLRPAIATSMNVTPNTASHASRSPRRALRVAISNPARPMVNATIELNASDCRALSNQPAARVALSAQHAPAHTLG